MAILFNSSEQEFSLPAIPQDESTWLYNAHGNKHFDPNKVCHRDYMDGPLATFAQCIHFRRPPTCTL